jgi:MFS family permease
MVFSATPPSVLSVYLSVFIDAFGGLVAMPVLPYLTFSLGGNGRDLGYLSAAYQFASIFSLPTTSKLSDMYGRRPFFLIGFLGSLVGFLIIAFSTEVWHIILGRFVGGMFGASMVSQPQPQTLPQPITNL